MKKVNKQLRQVGVVLVALVSLGAAAPVTTADAATWHKGLPKIVRHKMFRTKFTKDKRAPQYTWYKGTKSVLTTHSTNGGAASTISHTKYKKVGQTYFVKGFDKFLTAVSRKSGKVYGYVRIRKVSAKKVKFAEGKKTINYGGTYEGKYMTMKRFYHFPKFNGRVWN